MDRVSDRSLAGNKSSGRQFSRALLVFGLLLVLSVGGCRKFKNLLGIGDQVVNPKPGSAEALVQDLLRAGTDENRQRAWSDFVKLLHSQERNSRGAMSICQKSYWPGFRRKAGFFLTNPSKMAYDIMEDRPGETENYRKIFILNRSSDQPTPIPLKRDPTHGNSWRIAVCSL